MFKIADSRGSDVLHEMVTGDFRGVLSCDYFSAYRKFVRQTGPGRAVSRTCSSAWPI